MCVCGSLSLSLSPTAGWLVAVVVAVVAVGLLNLPRPLRLKCQARLSTDSHAEHLVSHHSPQPPITSSRGSSSSGGGSSSSKQRMSPPMLQELIVVSVLWEKAIELR